MGGVKGIMKMNRNRTKEDAQERILQARVRCYINPSAEYLVEMNHQLSQWLHDNKAELKKMALAPKDQRPTVTAPTRS